MKHTSFFFFIVAVFVPAAVHAGVAPDPFATPNAQVIFGGVELPPIPANFFGPGSDPFAGGINFQGDGGIDTLVQRDGPIVCPGAGLPLPCNPVAIEIIELQLTSTAPITVTFNGGMNPEPWIVDLGLSQINPQNQGNMNTTMDNPNGGTADFTLPVTPLFVFTQVSNPSNVQFIDAGLVIPLTFPPLRWSVQTTNPTIFAPSNGNFVLLVDNDVPQVGTGSSPGGEIMHTITPPPPPPPPIPTVSEWGLLMLTLSVILVGTLVFGRRKFFLHRT